MPLKRALKKVRQKLRSKRLQKILAIAGIVFVVLNVGVVVLYQGRTYPNVVIHNQRVGGLKRAQLAEKLDHMALLPDTVQLSYKDKSATLKPQEAGIMPDTNRTVQSLLSKRSLLPIANLVGTRHVPLQLKVDDQAFEKAYAGLQTTFHQDAVPTHIALENSTFAIKQQTDGFQLDHDAVKRELFAAVGRGQTSVTMPVKTIAPKHAEGDLESQLKTLQTQLNVSLTFNYQGKTKKLTSQEIAGWYVAKDNSYELSDEKMVNFLSQVATSFGIKAQNVLEARDGAKDALRNNKSLNFTFVPVPAVSKKYCSALRGVDASAQPGLDAKLRTVYADSRGWGLGGRVVLTKVTSGCDFTVWLASPDQMPSFGSICTSDWSCRSGPNVVINYDKWEHASDSWNQHGGSLDDYRTMVINHETGHWFGFFHANCPGAGQLAPVMQQQSIDLQGCTFNPWPLPSELAALKSSLGL